MFQSILIGLAAFFIFGCSYPMVIKMEYYFSARSWWVFLVAGLISLGVSIGVESSYVSTLLGVLAATFFWGIHEIKEQEERVQKGWFPQKTKRKATNTAPTNPKNV